ncbi:flagellar basal body rod protein FlgB [Aquincola sp. MAHUQ-54]|uniref:Flagellar basal body rod protein FlgB n=1 Tax=Aquincola agrisoli TaxID=3119538 RepID=A0AAW9QD79_9BURK
MIDRLTDTLNFQAQALTLRSERHQLIASNIANADTPGYVARDMNFSQALRSAIGDRSAASQLKATAAGHLQASGGMAGGPEMRYAAASQTSLDSNTVDMDRERATFVDNTLKYEAALRFLGGSVRTMVDAIKGQAQ